MIENQIIVGQLGSRQNYQIPCSFYRLGSLKAFFTDLYNPLGIFGQKIAKSTNINFLMRMASRWTSKLPSSTIHSDNILGIQMGIALQKRKDPLKTSEIITNFGQKFAKRVVNKIQNIPHNAYFGFCSESLEVFEWEKSVGNLTILDQYDAADDEFLFLEENERWPGWGRSYQRTPLFYERVYKEWKLADIILVNSEWTRTNIIKQGADPEKIFSIPISQPCVSVNLEGKLTQNNKKFRVIYVGAVNLRKGVQYLISAAEMLQGYDIEIIIIGGTDFTEGMIHNTIPNVIFTGHLPSKKVKEYYLTSDVFVFPTLSDGFGKVQLEAMSYGLPVIATTNCGNIVEDEKNGYIVPICNAYAIAKKIEILYKDRNLLMAMSANASNTIKSYSLDNFCLSIDSKIQQTMDRRNITNLINS